MRFPENQPTYRLRRTLSLESNPWLRDHVIGGKAVLPFTFAMHWMSRACEQLFPNYRLFALEDMFLYKGIVFEKNASLDFILDIWQREARQSTECFFDVIITSQKEPNVRYYKSTVHLIKKTKCHSVESRARLNFEKTTALLGAQLYGQKILFHGPLLQGVQEVLNIDDQGLTLMARAPDVSLQDQGQFQVSSGNPFIADIFSQSVIIWFKQMCGQLSLPMSCGAYKHYRSIPFGIPFYISLDVVKVSKSKVTTCLDSHDKEGKLYNCLKDCELFAAPNLETLFQQTSIESL